MTVNFNVTYPFKGAEISAPFFCLPCKAGKPISLKETSLAQTEGKRIRIARALLLTTRSEGSDRKLRTHSVMQTCFGIVRRLLCKIARSQILIQPNYVLEDGVLNREPV